MKLVIAVASMVVVLFYVGSSSFISQPQQAAGTASVEGIVVRAGTGEPIQGARVTLLFVPPPAPRGQAVGGINMIVDGLRLGLPPTTTHSAPADEPRVVCRAVQIDRPLHLRRSSYEVM